MSPSAFSFSLHSSTRHGPRLGSVALTRSGNATTESTIKIATPGLLATTSRGVIPHLSRDHVETTEAIRWVNVSLETFLEHNPPTPTLQSQQHGSLSDPHPLHTFLGFIPNQHIISMSARDPHDGRDMPPNGNTHISAHSLRGMRKLSPIDWCSYIQSCQPDIVLALSDTPFTDPPYSQKRLTKSNERSAAWLATLLNSAPTISTSPKVDDKKTGHPNTNTTISEPPSTVDTTANTSNHFSTKLIRIPPVFVHLAGMTSPSARKAFSDSLLEPLFGREAEAIKPRKTLDEGVAGYVVDLVPLRLSVEAAERKSPTGSSSSALVGHTSVSQIIPLLHISLAPLPAEKPRLLTATRSPHEILRYIGEVGVDLFDAGWVQKAADVGVALDFEFPVPTRSTNNGRQIGHNLYHTAYRLDFNPLSNSFRGALGSTSASVDVPTEDIPICPCAACSPMSPSRRIYHGYDNALVSGEVEQSASRHLPHYTRAYIHHLLHTHEMSAHALLAMHNLTVLDLFFAGIRKVIAEDQAQEGEDRSKKWKEDVRHFEETYDVRLGVLEEAKERWREVDLARGKGRLAREKGKQAMSKE